MIGFRKERCTVDSITAMEYMMASQKEYKLETHMAFIEYEIAFDRLEICCRKFQRKYGTIYIKLELLKSHLITQLFKKKCYKRNYHTSLN